MRQTVIAGTTLRSQDVVRNLDKLCKEWKNDKHGISYKISHDPALSEALLTLVENLDFIED
jgi:HD-like signal output (HDOD) protein